MLLTEPDNLPDVFQDGNTAGVKELFNTYEEELLPTDEQLKRYRKKDLYSSHFYRTSYKVFGPQKNIRRLHYVEGNPFSNVESKHSVEENASNLPNGIVLPSYYAPKFSVSKPAKKPAEENSESAEVNYHDWLNERKKLREGLNSFGLNISWLERKPERTCLEDQVLAQLQKHANDETRSKGEKSISRQTETLVVPVPPSLMQTLKVVAQHLLENKLSISSFFKNSETNSITAQHCEDGLSVLQQNGIISSESVEDVVNHFYKHNESNSLLYLKLTQIIKDLNASSSTLTTRFGDSLKEIKEEKSNDNVAPQIRPRTIAEAMALRRSLRIAEFEETLKRCEQKSVPLGSAMLKKVLLHPGDVEPDVEFASVIRQPGEAMSENFWKADLKKRTRRKKIKENEQNNKHIQERANCDTDSEEGSLHSEGSKLSWSDSGSNSRESVNDIVEASRVIGVQTARFSNRKNVFKLPYFESGESITHHKRRKDSNSVGSEDTDDTSVNKHDHTVIRFPSLRDTLPERHYMNLSTGRALIGRKVDCWMSAEEFENINSTLVDTPLRRQKPNSNAFWPGHYNKMRLWRSPCDSHRPPKCDNSKSKRSVFHLVKTLPHNGHRSNYGYDNNMLTWPTDGRYVKYGDIDQDKVYHI